VRRVIDAIFVLGLGQAMVLLCGIATVKIMAVVAGTAAVGAFSLIRGFQQVCTALGSFGNANWIVQGIASGRKATDSLGFARAAWWISVGAAVAIFVVAVVLGPASVFGAKGTEDVFSRAIVSWIAVASVLGIVLNFFRAWLLARLRIGKVTRVNVLSGLVSIVLAWPIARSMRGGNYELSAVLLVVSLGVGAVAAALYCMRIGPEERPGNLLRRPSMAMVGMTLSIAVPTLAVYSVGVVTVFVLRMLAAREFGVSAAGMFDAAWTVSTVGLGMLLTTVSNYLLPATGMEDSHSKRLFLFEASLRSVMFIALPLIVGVICTREVLLRIFYSHEFLPAADMLRWMLIGDYLKITGWLLATVAYARRYILAYGIIESIWCITALTLSWGLTARGESIEAFGIAYLGAHVLYFLSWVGYAARRGFFSFTRRTAMFWTGGLFLVIGASAAAWNPSRLRPMDIALVLLVTAAFLLAASKKSERAALVRTSLNALKQLR